MYRLIETIKLCDGIAQNLNYHNLRLNHARKELFGLQEATDLAREIRVPDEFSKGLYKCRVIYSEEIKEIQYEPYVIKRIKSLKIVYDNSISYSYKFQNRDSLNQLFSLREQADDVIIVKNEFITDSSFCNLVFENTNGLVTPSTPLLKGTKREKLLVEKNIYEKEIRIDDLKNYQYVHLINAFLDPGDIVIRTQNILH